MHDIADSSRALRCTCMDALMSLTINVPKSQTGTGSDHSYGRGFSSALKAARRGIRRTGGGRFRRQSRPVQKQANRASAGLPDAWHFDRRGAGNPYSRRCRRRAPQPEIANRLGDTLHSLKIESVFGNPARSGWPGAANPANARGARHATAAVDGDAATGQPAKFRTPEPGPHRPPTSCCGHAGGFATQPDERPHDRGGESGTQSSPLAVLE